MVTVWSHPSLSRSLPPALAFLCQALPQSRSLCYYSGSPSYSLSLSLTLSSPIQFLPYNSFPPYNSSHTFSLYYTKKYPATVCDSHPFLFFLASTPRSLLSLPVFSCCLLFFLLLSSASFWASCPVFLSAFFPLPYSWLLLRLWEPTQRLLHCPNALIQWQIHFLAILLPPNSALLLPKFGSCCASWSCHSWPGATAALLV